MLEFFIASTKQHVGKTTLSLGLFSGLQKRGLRCLYMKPVGQEVEESSPGLFLDKDACLMKKQFQIKSPDEPMSPVLVPPGFTRDYLDGKICSEDLKNRILKAHGELYDKDSCLLVEGTGHMGVGSTFNLNNAQVAKALRLPVLLIATGGLGSAFDELSLNKTLCDLHGVPILGVVLNRVKPEKKAMIQEYMQKALRPWGVPLLGCIPLDNLLSIPSFADLQKLFQGTMLSGQTRILSHFTQIRLAAASTPFFKETLEGNPIIITPAHREDTILATLAKVWEPQLLKKNPSFHAALILTGSLPPRSFITDELKKVNIPAFYTPLHSDQVLKKINTFTAKIQKDDQEKILEAISVVEENLDFDLLLSRL